MQSSRKINRRKQLDALAKAAAVALALGGGRVTNAADSSFMVTWAVSGSTAMRNFTISVGFTELEANGSLILSNGTYSGGTDGLQLAPPAYTGNPLPGSSGAGVRMEWHEQGSVEGILDMANDQIGYAGGVGAATTSYIVDPTSRNPTSGNPIRLNRNNFTGTGSINNYTVSFSSYNTYDPANYGTLGTNLQGGQNRVQMAISDVKPIQGFSKASGTTPAPGTPLYALLPGNTGFGKGNTLLTAPTINGLGVAGGRQQLTDDGSLNMPTTNIDPNTVTGGGSTAYGVGSWNTNGLENLVSKTVAMTATVMAANPGTGLTQINKSDVQWLQVAGRLQNGADFNVSERDVNSGTRNTFANNTGVDGSWAVGDNDDGNGNPGNPIGAAAAQASIGPLMRFSGKTAGGGQLRPTIQNNRMAMGPLGMADAIGAVKNNTNSSPLRALAYSNTVTDLGANFVQPTAATISDGSYVPWQQEQYVTVRTPDSNYNNEDSIKGDPMGDVAKLRNNVLNSVNVTFPNQASEVTPADQLLLNSFLLPQMMLVDKPYDGQATTDVSNVVVNGQTHAQWRQAMLNDPNVPLNFNSLPAASVTGGGSSNYGVAGGANGLAAGAVAVPITAHDSAGGNTSAAGAPKGNYLFGNFNQTGVRDLNAVLQAQTAQAALWTAGGTLSGTGTNAAAVDVNYVGGGSISNATKVTTGTPMDAMNAGGGTNNLASKGDLIVSGDFNGDGKFDGLDIYRMARGASITDSAATSTINMNGGTLGATALTFGDKVRSGVLHKNAMLDYFNTGTYGTTYGPLTWGSSTFTGATAQQKKDATANATNDLNGVNAFNKADVNRDGLVNRADAQVVDHFLGKDYRSLDDQAQAVIADNGTLFDSKDASGHAVAETPKPISLVDVELNDTGNIDITDFAIERAAVGIKLLEGDANFDGVVDIQDLLVLAQHYNQTFNHWSDADFSLDGVVNTVDLGLLAANWQGGPTSLLAGVSSLGLGGAVPEPASLAVISLASMTVLGQRRRRRAR